MLNNIGLPGIIVILIVFGLVIRSIRRSTGQNEERAVTNPPVTDTNSGQIEKTIISGKCYVIDGDTIAIKKQKIRLVGINARELNEPYGKQAKWAMVELCKG
jgi:micrococcal nuclease